METIELKNATTLRQITTNGDFSLLATVARDGSGNLERYCRWALLQPNGWFEKVGFGKGDEIGVGYACAKVLKPFDAFVVFDNYSTGSDEYCNTAVVVPAFGFAGMRSAFEHDDLWKKGGARDYVSHVLLTYIHDVDGRDCDERDDGTIGEYLRWERTSMPLVKSSASPDTPIVEAKLYWDVQSSIEKSLFGSELVNAHKYKKPKGLAKFVKERLTVSDFVQNREITEEEYKAEQFHGGLGRIDRKLENFKPYTEWRLNGFLPFGLGGNEKRLPTLYRKLRDAGFRPFSDKDAKKLLADERRIAEKARKDKEESKRQATIANISKLGKDEVAEIVMQWGLMMDKAGKGRRISVNGKEVCFDGLMKIRPENGYESTIGEFQKCLLAHGFAGKTDRDDTTVKKDISSLVPLFVMLGSESNTECEVFIGRDWDDGMKITLHVNGNSVVYQHFTVDGSSFSDAIATIAKDYGKFADMDVSQLIARSNTTSRFGVECLRDRVLEVISVRQLVNACRDYIEGKNASEA